MLQPMKNLFFLMCFPLVAMSTGCGSQKPANSETVEKPASMQQAPPEAPVRELVPFRVEYRRITYFPTCRSNTRVRIDPDGAVYAMISDRDCPEGELFSAPWPEEPKTRLSEDRRRRLMNLILDGGFMTVEPPPRGPVSDGYREEIEVEIEGSKRTVTVHNGTKVKGWDAVRAFLVSFTL